VVPELWGYSGANMKKAAVIALVLLVLLVGLPFAMGTSDMAPCPSCTGVERPVAVTMCLAIVSLFVLIVSSSSSVIGSRRQVVRLLLLDDPLERPPRVA
jgi:hypothetical protein